MSLLKRRSLIPPHFSVGKAGKIFGFFELPCEVALIVEAAKMRDLLYGFIRKAQQIFTVIYTRGDNVLKNCFAVDFFVFARQIEFAYVEFRSKAFKGKLLVKMVVDVIMNGGKLLFKSRIIALRVVVDGKRKSKKIDDIFGGKYLGIRIFEFVYVDYLRNGRNNAFERLWSEHIFGVGEEILVILLRGAAVEVYPEKLPRILLRAFIIM